ncbi:hypothetical protein SAMN04487962_1233 [Marinobacter segnicrescens]|uniref:Asparagine synthase n=1 Tax=Marinobacter segnicrescens TaxID=430453 RepID=A0A1I0H103_9GAMM|nr:hypothetical protein [Marinobacter segnicrescens]SET77375.1 hypothetical protein SAMN04487962_1233 [Marinobacter segnicrescens]
MDPTLPRLGWIAETTRDKPELTVYYGCDVETSERHLVEGVWDGPYEDLEFDSSNHFFGSGLLIRDNEVIATPSTGLVDRIFVGESMDSYYISNSLIEILARTDSRLDPGHNYKTQTDTIRAGINYYDHEFPILSDHLVRLRQFYFHPVVIKKDRIFVTPRASKKHFPDFEAYQATLISDLHKIASNASSLGRKKPFELYTTVSRGYDSTAVTALVSDLPIRKAFTSRSSNSAILGLLSKSWGNDDGTEIAKKLGLTVEHVDLNDSEIGQDELYFLAPTSAEPEIQLYKITKSLSLEDNPGLLFTGYHGDTVWALHPPASAMTHDIIKPGSSGLTLSEVRLKAGFIDVPVPTMYACNIVSINSLSLSDELKHWSIGGDYDRPIPRKIAEARGVLREDFGQSKKAIATLYDLPKNRMLRRKFILYLSHIHGISYASVRIKRLQDLIQYYIQMILFRLDLLTLKTKKISRPLNRHTIDTPYYMHIWSLSELVKERTKSLRKGDNRSA